MSCTVLSVIQRTIMICIINAAYKLYVLFTYDNLTNIIGIIFQHYISLFPVY